MGRKRTLEKSADQLSAGERSERHSQGKEHAKRDVRITVGAQEHILVRGELAHHLQI